MTEIRQAIRTNWSVTGNELSRELRQFWQGSRPSSPARRSDSDISRSRGNAVNSPSALDHLKHLDIPSRTDSPGAASRNEDFATGYSLGLIGGVRSWYVCHSRFNLVHHY